MKSAVLAAVVCLAAPLVLAGQTAAERAPQTPTPAAAPDKLAEAYDEFLNGRHLEESDDVAGAIAAFKRAIELDPSAADIPAELAGLYMQQNRAEEALAAANQALKIDPANRAAHRVAGIVYAAIADSTRGATPKPDDANVAKAIEHLEAALDRPVGNTDPSVRATLARLYVRTRAFAKAIPLLTDLVSQESGWQDGPLLLAEAYAGAGRTADAIQWLEEAAPEDPQLYPTLAEFYERDRRWKQAADAYAKALAAAPRNSELKTWYASALLNAGGRENVGKAREALADLLSTRPNDARALYLLSQAERRLGDMSAAEATSRRIIAQAPKSPWGYSALAEALEEQRQYQAIVDVLAPAISDFRSRATGDSFEVGLLLPHLGLAYQQLRDYNKALPVFEEAHKLSPNDAAITGYLVETNISAKKYAAAVQIARQARADRPDDLRLASLEAQALRQGGKADQGIALLEGVVHAHADQAYGYLALAQLYSEADRGAQAVKVLQDAQAKFSTEASIPFELGAVLDKQKRYADAEAAFRQALERDPESAQTLNYLGYMLAERSGNRLDESIGYIKKALEIDPDNGSYLDSLGWAYFKADKLDLAEENLKRAADQLTANSVIQDHYGDLLFKRARYREAIAAWTRALSGDGDTIDRGAVEKKVRGARQKLGKR